jgi:hypothetical protein
MKKILLTLAVASALAPSFASAHTLCRHAPKSKTGVDPYLVCLAEGGLPTSGTNPALVGE